MGQEPPQKSLVIAANNNHKDVNNNKKKRKTFTMFDTEAIKIKIRKQCRNLHCKQTISYFGTRGE